MGAVCMHIKEFYCLKLSSNSYVDSLYQDDEIQPSINSTEDNCRKVQELGHT